MKQQITALVKAFQNKLSGRSDKYPFVQQFNHQNVNFKYWITDSVYETWYDPEGQKAWVETQAYFDFIEQNDRVLEVGCNVGFYTVLVRSLAGKGGIVVGLDVVPENVMIAQAQLSLNNFENCTILNCGGGASRSKLRVQNTNNGFVVKGNSIGSIEVDIIPCDELLSEFGSFNVVKIDVEGFEGDVVAGCKKILSARPKIIIEMHGDEILKYGSTAERIFNEISIDDYEGTYCFRSENALHKFDRKTYPLNAHATLFLKPRKSR